MRRRTLLLALAPAAARLAPPAGAPRARAWLVLDFDAVFCGGCLAPVRDFLRAVPTAVQESAMTAVLTFAASAERGGWEGRRRIVRTKWEGLRRTDAWVLPAVLDREAGFRAWLGARTARVVLFDPARETATALGLPLAPSDLDALIAALC